MDWPTLILAAGAVVVYLLWRRMGLIGIRQAQEMLKQGAVVIDVRSEAEYQGRHFPKAINVPLGELSETIPRLVPDKHQPILLHCLSGGRSAMARGTLRRMGYRQVFNLGGYGRAAVALGRSQARL